MYLSTWVYFKIRFYEELDWPTIQVRIQISLRLLIGSDFEGKVSRESFWLAFHAEFTFWICWIDLHDFLSQ